ncbi:trypsin alpha-3-like [Anopheles moucheti]|uniref:trypsin alpha-3-like n=1 Tax=Anopheles moucheti TaxID=186751 RepID=UPI0022F06598|nr:trypsin alpha-3-like [Anopheles moucheti]
MKQVIGLVLLGLICSNVVLAEDGTPANEGSHSGRIVNGVAVNITNYPYALSMFYKNTYFCGASIITASHALTAGHCVEPYMEVIPLISVHGGSTSPNTGGFLIKVIKIDMLDSLNRKTFEFDAAVVTVAKNAFSGKRNMAPIALQTSEMAAGTPCSVVGWGRTNVQVPAPTSELRYIQMNIVSQANCTAAWAGGITSNMVCARYGNGVDICKGDSGGALVCGGKLTGIVSFDNPRCIGSHPAGFTKVIAPIIRSFIRSHTGI